MDLTALTASAILVTGYVTVVALRGRGTHLGGDTIALLYVSTIGMFAASVLLWFWDWRQRRVDRFTVLALALSAIVFGAWLYLRSSGRVVSYEQMIDLHMNRPKTVERTGASRSPEETNQTLSAGDVRR